MKIQKLLEQHHKYASKLALQKNLGDGFLLEKNKIYQRIRQKSLDFGFQYDSAPNESYWVLPLSQLEELIQSQKIPYVNNVSVLEQIEKAIPGASSWDDVTDNLKRNHLFHEACHGVARSIAGKYFKTTNSSSVNGRNETILKLMIEESFANTCELVGIMDVEDGFHKLFYEINSYIFMYEDKSNLKNLFNDYGKKKAFMFLLLSYLHANYIHPRFEDKSLDSVLKVLFDKSGQFANIKADAKKMKTFRAISKVCFELNPRFRMVTSVFYLKLIGYPASQEDLMKMDFMKLITTLPVFMDFINELTDLVMN